MNNEIISQVQQSWAKVQPIAPQAAELFYRNLFALEPSLKSLFKGDMKAQGEKLMQMIGTAVARLAELDALVPVLQGLGKRHASYGVVASHYDTVGAAFLTTLAQGLGDEFTPEVKAAWTTVYGVMSKVMIEAAASSPAAGKPAPAELAISSGEFLTFTLASEAYGVDILKVQEIRGYDSVTKIANAPEHVKGVINLRGTIVPIIDLRLKFKLEQVTYDQFTVVIILNLGARVVGIVVDGVSDVTQLGADQIKPPPQLGVGVETSYIRGLGSIDGRMIILADIEKLLDVDELNLQQAA
jgi:purine-binding chemotaxis protein CheW